MTLGPLNNQINGLVPSRIQTDRKIHLLNANTQAQSVSENESLNSLVSTVSSSRLGTVAFVFCVLVTQRSTDCKWFRRSD